MDWFKTGPLYNEIKEYFAFHAFLGSVDKSLRLQSIRERGYEWKLESQQQARSLAKSFGPLQDQNCFPWLFPLSKKSLTLLTIKVRAPTKSSIESQYKILLCTLKMPDSTLDASSATTLAQSSTDFAPGPQFQLAWFSIGRIEQFIASTKEILYIAISHVWGKTEWLTLNVDGEKLISRSKATFVQKGWRPSLVMVLSGWTL